MWVVKINPGTTSNILRQKKNIEQKVYNNGINFIIFFHNNEFNFMIKQAPWTEVKNEQSIIQIN